MAEEFVYGGDRESGEDTLSQALARVKRFRNASFKAAYADGDAPSGGAAAQAALAAAAASACAAARCAADAAADGAFVARSAAAALTLVNTSLTGFWNATQRDYQRLLTAHLGAEGTVGAHLPGDFWNADQATNT